MSSAGGRPTWQAMVSVRTSLVPPGPCPPLEDTPGASPAATAPQVTASIHDFAVSLEKTPAEFGYGTQSLTVFVADLDAHYNEAKTAGATIVEDLHETIYGERQYGARDLDGHHWLFSTHARDVSPSEWGATITISPRSQRAGS